MSRRQRQRDELRELCETGALARAVDLAFHHFADFGRDDAIVRTLAAAIDRAPSPVGSTVLRRFADLCASHPGAGEAR
jgi:hypothetical protein